MSEISRIKAVSALQKGEQVWVLEKFENGDAVETTYFDTDPIPKGWGGMA